MLKKILVPTDFSECASTALDEAAQLAAKCDAELILLHVRDDVLLMAPEGGYVPADFYAQQAKDVEDRLAAAQARVHKSGARVRSVHLFGAPHKLILEEAERECVDLIVMGTHGRGALTRMMLGSVAERIARTSKVPVLTMHARARSKGQHAA